MYCIVPSSSLPPSGEEMNSSVVMARERKRFLKKVFDNRLSYAIVLA